MRLPSILLPVLSLALAAAYSAGCSGAPEGGGAKRAVLYVIDGLAADAPRRIDMPQLNALRAEGTYYRETYLVQPAHPHSGAWAAMYSSSIPNPVMLSGTIFIKPGQQLVNQCFRNGVAAHSTNSMAYVSLNDGYNLSFMQSAEDSAALHWARYFLKDGGAEFIRIHLQSVGGAGSRSYETEENVPWKGDIWAGDSPYRRQVMQADRELGEFVRWLKSSKLYDSTYLFITADHGQADTGWHPPYEEGGWKTPLLIIGPGIKKGAEFEYAESIDITPTICRVMDVDPPGNVSGRVLLETIAASGQNGIPSERNLKTLDFLLRDTERSITGLKEAVAKLPAARQRTFSRRLEAIEANFYSIERFVEWPKFGSVQELIEHNQGVLEELNGLKTQLG